VFAQPAAVPDFAWKSHPQVGHLKGTIRDESGTAVDAGDLTLARVEDTPAPSGRTAVTGTTDGNGFYGGVDLAPGTWEVTVTPVRAPAWTAACQATLLAGQVATLDLTIDRAAPTATVTVSPSVVWPPNHETVQVTLTGQATDIGTGIASIDLRVMDEYGEVEPAIASLAGNGVGTLDWQVAVPLQASRKGDDLDGRLYTIEVVVTDRACQRFAATAQVVVPHDQRR
jgi:hypothetical protein